MQRGFLHTIQQLQAELTEARERSGAQKDGLQVSREGSAESSFVQSIANSVASNGSATTDGNQPLKNNGSADASVKVWLISNYFGKQLNCVSMGKVKCSNCLAILIVIHFEIAYFLPTF
jgi:hypothetical protein